MFPGYYNSFSHSNNYMFNKENDALSYDSQLINRTNYAIHQDMCEQFGRSAVCDMYSDNKSSTIFSSADDGQVYATGTSTEAAETSTSYVLRTHTDNKFIEYGGGVGGVCGLSDDEGSCYEYCDDIAGQYSLLSNTSKQLPNEHSSSKNILEGMYIQNHHHLQHTHPTQHQIQSQHQHQPQQRHGASLPRTPPMAHKKSRLLPQPSSGMCINTNVSSAGTGGYAHGCQRQPNGHGSSVGGCASSSSSSGSDKSCFVEVGEDAVGAANGKCLPMVPLRMLPQPYAYSSTSYKHDLIANALQRKLLLDVAPTVNRNICNSSKYGDNMYGMCISNFVENSLTISDYKNYTAETDMSTAYSYTAAMMGVRGSGTALQLSLQRPHSSLAPLNYNENYYSNNAFNRSSDNISTYSEPTNAPTVVTTASSATLTAQLQLQQQCKSSIIMAMTSASVIASGETHVTPHKQPHAHSEGDTKRNASNVNKYRSSSFNHESEKQDQFVSEDYILKEMPVKHQVDNNMPATCTTLTEHPTNLSTTLPTSKNQFLPITNLVTTSTANISIFQSNNNINMRSINCCSNNKLNNNNINNIESSSLIGSINNSGSSNNKQLPKLLANKLVATCTSSANAYTTTETANAIETLTYTTTSATSDTVVATDNSTYNNSSANKKIIYDSLTAIIPTATSISTTVPIETTTPSALTLNLCQLNPPTDNSLVYISNLDYNSIETISSSTEEAIIPLPTDFSKHSNCNNNTAPFENNINCNPVLNSLEAVTVTTSAETTTDAIDYNDYLKAFTLPTFSDYISNFDCTHELENTYASTLVTCIVTKSTTSPTFKNAKFETLKTFTTSATSTTFSKTSISSPSLYSSSTMVAYGSNILAVNSSRYLLSTTTHVSADYVTSRTTACDNISAKIPTLTLQSPPITPFSSTTKSGHIIMPAASATPSVPPCVTFSKENVDEISCYSSTSKYPLEIITTIAATKSSCNTTDLFTTTALSVISSADVIGMDKISTAETKISVAAVVESDDKLASIAALNISAKNSVDDASYNEYMKQFNLDAYRSEVSFSSVATTSTQSYSNNEYLSNLCFSPLSATCVAFTTPPAANPARNEATNDTPMTQYMQELDNDFVRSHTTTSIKTATSAILTLDEINSTASANAFDDNFYDSYSVDLSTLTASALGSIEAETNADKPAKSSNGSSYKEMLLRDNSYSKMNYDITATNTPMHALDTHIATTDPQQTFTGSSYIYQQPEVQRTPLKSPSAAGTTVYKSVADTAAVANKANSMLDGLSKGLKVGLDGVLNGVSVVVATDSTKPQQAKKGFGFGLAAKLVPNVGGLLQSAAMAASSTNMSKPVAVTTTVAAVTVTENDYCYESDSNMPFSSDIYAIAPTDSNVYYSNSSRSSSDISNMLPTVTTSELYKETNIFSHGSDAVTKIVDYSTDYKYGYDEYGYSESDYIATGDIMEITNNYNNAYHAKTTSSFDDPQRKQNYSTTWPNDAIPMLAATANANSNISPSQPVTLMGAVIPSVVEPTAATISVKAASRARGGSGIFGSFLGKAAAAVQSATQAVNQGAIIATSAVHKTPQTPSTAAPPKMSADNDNNYLKQHYGNKYYAKENQQQELATVTPVASSGKKLPTINGKLGFLMKQQPTEIFDDDDGLELDDEDEEENAIIDEYIGHDAPNYRLDSEQNDYYVDLLQAPSLSRRSSADLALTANGYYEHTNGGYDYREDYFNEEDEYKYLETEQKAAHEALLMHQQHTQTLLKQHQKQPPLEYIEESRDDYIDDNYPSEDSGNYIEESSSGSGAVSVTTNIIDDHVIMATSSTTATYNISSTILTSASSTQQHIKKQDSIIVEEDEDDMIDLESTIGRPVCVAMGAGSTILLRQSSDILDDDDHTMELPQILLKKKRMLTRGETEEVVGGHIQMLRKPEVTAKQRWHWAYNKIIMQLNVSTDELYIIM